MPEFPFLIDFTLVIGVTLVASVLARGLRLPSMVGYLLASVAAD